MPNLKTLTVEQLQNLIKEATEEIALRESQGSGFYKEFSVGGKKAYTPATYKQLQYAESLANKTGSEIKVTTSQIIKYFEMEEMSEAIDLMKEGKRISIS